MERVKYTLKRNWKTMSQVVVAVKHFLNMCNWRWRSSPWRMRRNLGQEQHSSEMKKVTKMFKVITEMWDTRQSRCTKKWHAKYATFQKWQHDLYCEHQTMSWLECNTEKEDKIEIATTVKCKVCIDFVSKIRGRKNFSEKWIFRADSVHISNACDHARNDQHVNFMSLLKKQS